MSQQELVIRPSTWRTAVALVAVTLAAVACGITAWKAHVDGETFTSLVLALGTILIAATIPFACVTIAMPTSLVLSEAGFRMTGIGRIPLVRWSTVEEFVLLNRDFKAGHGVSGRVRGIGFRLKPGMSVDVGWKRHVYVSGVDGEVALNLTTTVDETYAVLEKWRRDWGLDEHDRPRP